MASVHIRINGKEYSVACDDGQEAQLRFLAEAVDQRARTLVKGMGVNPGEIMTLLLTSLMMADELSESKEEIKYIREEVRRLSALAEQGSGSDQEGRILEMENAMAMTLEEIALRIEKIAHQLELS